MRDEWAELAATASDEDLRERILTGFKSGKPFTPYFPTLPLPESIASVLDFGCGLGPKLCLPDDRGGARRRIRPAGDDRAVARARAARRRRAIE